MPHLKQIVAVLLVCSLPALGQGESVPNSVAGKADAQGSIPKPSAAVETPLPPPEPVPIASMTAEELPAQAPRVTYSAGWLTIEATNATLVDILTAIQTKTGAVIETPPGAGSSERVAVHLAGPPNEVIPALLDGSKFGYVIRASPDDPQGIAEVVLNRKTPSGAQPGSPASAASEVARKVFDRKSAMPENTAATLTVSEQPAALPIVAMEKPDKDKDNEKNKDEDKSDQPAQSAPSPSVATIIEDPHPPSPVQLTANSQNPDQEQVQQNTNRQFMQDLYQSRQKLQQPQPGQPQP
jgi:hypothetical protein